MGSAFFTLRATVRLSVIFFKTTLAFCTQLRYNNEALWHAGVVEWQTRRTQNPFLATGCGFKSHHRHQTGSLCDAMTPGFFYTAATDSADNILFAYFKILPHELAKYLQNAN